MAVHLYSPCYNEAIIIPYYLKHYHFVDKIFICDNNSSDNSVELLKADKRVEISSFDNPEYDETQLTKFRNNAWKNSIGEADYVIVCDIDEFAYIDNPLDRLTYAKMEFIQIIIPEGFRMVGDRLPTTKGFLQEEIGKGVPSTRYSKAIIFDPNSIREINYSPGSHRFSAESAWGREPDILIGGGWKLLHYSWLSLDYIVNRYSKVEARTSIRNKELGLAHDYAKTLSQLKREYQLYLRLRSKVL